MSMLTAADKMGKLLLAPNLLQSRSLCSRLPNEATELIHAIREEGERTEDSSGCARCVLLEGMRAVLGRGQCTAPHLRSLPLERLQREQFQPVLTSHTLTSRARNLPAEL
jgi:hypothetical protein